jgi:3-deoxy-7-phosphoheptulonate synthase
MSPHPSMPVIDASHSQTLLGGSSEGVASAVSTAGNPDCQLILRSGDDRPNLDINTIKATRDTLLKPDLASGIMADVSHSNCGKDYTKIPAVFKEIIYRRSEGDTSAIGAMLESPLVAGNQKFPKPLNQFSYG